MNSTTRINANPIYGAATIIFLATSAKKQVITPQDDQVAQVYAGIAFTRHAFCDPDVLVTLRRQGERLKSNPQNRLALYQASGCQL